LSEGVDVPAVDMVSFSQPKSSTIDIIQTVGRAMRKAPNKTVGYIFIPVLLRDGEDIEDAVDRTEFGHVYDILQAMREQDEVLSAAIDDFRVRQLAGEDTETDLPNIIIDTDLPVDLRMLRKAITVRLVDGVTPAAKNVIYRKAVLLRLARSGAPRPSMYSKNRNEKTLANTLSQYACRKTHSSYDPEFAAEIRRIAPHWFVPSSNKKKQILLEMARNGEDRPSPQTDKRLYDMFRNYIKPGHKCYDQVFVEEIMAIAPHWFSTGTDRAKEELLRMAREGEPKPSRYSKDSTLRGLADAFHKFSRPGSDRYDGEFVRQIHSIVSKWYDSYDRVPLPEDVAIVVPKRHREVYAFRRNKHIQSVIKIPTAPLEHDKPE
jgi:superfamily II DNA/RNA helicase